MEEEILFISQFLSYIVVSACVSGSFTHIPTETAHKKSHIESDAHDVFYTRLRAELRAIPTNVHLLIVCVNTQQFYYCCSIICRDWLLLRQI